VDLIRCYSVGKSIAHYITNQYHGGYHGNDLIDFFFLDYRSKKRDELVYIEVGMIGFQLGVNMYQLSQLLG